MNPQPQSISPSPASTARQPVLGVYTSLLLYSILIASSFPVGEAVANLISPLVLTSLRFALASATFLLILLLRQGMRRPSASVLGISAVLALIMSVFFSLMFKALQTASALNTGALFTFAPLLAVGFGLVINRVSVTSWQVLCLLVGAAGATWIVFRGDLQALLAFTIGEGELLFLFGTVCFSLYSPLTKRFLAREDVAVATFWVLLFSAIYTGLLAFYEAGPVAVSGITVEGWIAIVYLAVFPTATTFFISTRASTIMEPFKVASFVYLVPVIVAAIQFLLMGRLISPSVMAGILVTTTATVLVQFDGLGKRSRRGIGNANRD